MGRQYNKVIKRKRRTAWVRRKNQAVTAAKAARAGKSAAKVA